MPPPHVGAEQQECRGGLATGPTCAARGLDPLVCCKLLLQVWALEQSFKTALIKILQNK